MAETALGDLRVLDLSTGWGMYAAKLLADLGADVIKVEPPQGSEQRYRGPYLDPLPVSGQGKPNPEGSIFFWYHNTNKRGVTLNLDMPEDRETLRALVREADVLIEGYRPGYLAERGLGFRDLQAVNPRLIVTSVTTFGQN